MSLQAGVFYREFDVSEIVSADGNLPGAQVIASKRGPAFTRVLSTNTRQFLEVFGTPDPSVSYGHYAALAFLENGNTLWTVRAVGAGAQYGCHLLQKRAADTSPTLQNVNTVNPTTYDFSVSVNGSSTAAENIALLYPAQGPGSYSSTLSLEIVSANLVPVVDGSFTVTGGSAGGVLPAGTYSYAVTATNSYGETAATVIKNVVIASGTTNKVTLAWGAVPGASGYRIYGRTDVSGQLTLLATVTSASVTYVDTGAAIPTVGTVQPTTDQIVDANDFTLSVYDSSISTVNPVEQFVVTLSDSLDGFGKQQRIEDVINEQSRYLRVLSNMAVVGTAPLVNPIAKKALPAGTSGSAVTDSDIMNGWALFEDTEQVSVRLLINSGYSTVAVQREMIRIAEKRQDCIAFLDVPSAKQRAADVLVYRNTTLNANSSRAALFAQDLYIVDRYNGRQIYVPPSGHMAGLAVRSAYLTAEWYSMAGLNRGQLNVVSVRYQYSDGERELLKAANTNYVRDFPGQGLCLWEQVTQQSKKSALSWISVRMLIDSIQIASRKFAMYSVHEPNDEMTGRQLVSGLSDFLQTIVNRRGLQRFLVVSDSRNNSASTVGQGQRKVDIYLTPTLPADQILISGIVTRQDAVFEEMIGRF